MNSFQYLKSLFTPSHSGILKTKVEAQMPPVESISPSCFAKGVAELWKRGEGWRFEKSSYVATRRGRRIAYFHHESGLSLEWYQYQSGYLCELDVWLGDNIMIDRLYDRSCADAEHILECIKSHPYPALKRLLNKKLKTDQETKVKIKEIEELGCSKPFPAQETANDARLI